jgi:hypothetical protein
VLEFQNQVDIRRTLKNLVEFQNVFTFVQGPVDSDFIHDSYNSLAATSYFMFINLFNGYFRMRPDISHRPHTVIAGFREVYYSKRALS